VSRVIALVQARMGSTRFPGKILAELGGYPILEWVLQRVSRARMIDVLVLATTTLSRDDELVALAQKLGIEVFRGSETDVLGRFAAAAAQYGADAVVRICADNPFVDADEIDRLVSHFRNNSCDYACNHQARLGNHYADGFGAEILSNDLLQKLTRVVANDRHREHVTLYVWDHSSEYRLSTVPTPKELAYPELRFDVDHLHDLTYLNTLIKAGVNIGSTAKDVILIALNSRRATLVTTDLPLSLPSTLDNTYFLGSWCFSSRHDEKQANAAGRIIDFHWNDREKLKRDFERLHIIQEELLDELSIILNQIHRVNESKKFWRLLLGYWLNIYTTVLFDRWSSLEQARKMRQSWQTYVIPDNDEVLAVADTAEFIQKATHSSYWNHALYALLLQNMPEITLIPIDGKLSAITEPALDKTNNYSVKPFVKTAIVIGANWLKRNDSLFLIDAYLSIKNLMRLELALGQFPLPRLNVNSRLAPDFDSEKRKWSVPIDSDKKGYDVIVRKLLPKFIPRVFVEGYQELMLRANKLPWPKLPKVIFTSNRHFDDDLFKAWAAKKVENGARFVIGEHGGLGTGLFNGAHRYEVSIADTYLSTGWSDSKHRNIVPIGNWRPKSNKVKSNLSGKALLVCGTMPRYSFDIRSMMLSSQVLDYFDGLLRFIDSLKESIRAEILVRLHSPDYGWEQRHRFLDRYPAIAFDDGHLTMMDMASQCRLFIGTYNATTYIEALTLNFPTVMFWNPLHWEVKIEAKPFFEKLKDAGVLHESAESAAKHISNIWNDIPEWWQSETVQLARNLFCDAYAATPPDLIQRLKSILLEEANRSTITQ